MQAAAGPRSFDTSVPPPAINTALFEGETNSVEGGRNFTVQVPAYNKPLPPLPPSAQSGATLEHRRSSFTQFEEGRTSPNTRIVLRLQDLVNQAGRSPMNPEATSSAERSLVRRDSLDISLLKMMEQLAKDQDTQVSFDRAQIERMIQLHKAGELNCGVFYLLLEPYDTQHRLKPSLAALLPTYIVEPWFLTLTQEMMEISANLCIKSNPYRDEVPGATFFISYLRHEFSKVFGKFHFAFMAYRIVTSIMPKNRKDSVTPPSPTDKLAEEIKHKFLTELATLFTTHFHGKSPHSKTLSAYFLELAEKNQFTLTSPKLLLVNFIFLRCINADLSLLSAAIGKIADKKEADAKEYLLRVNTYLIDLMKRLQALAKKEDMLPHLEIIYATVLSLPKEDISPLLERLKEVHVS